MERTAVKGGIAQDSYLRVGQVGKIYIPWSQKYHHGAGGDDWQRPLKCDLELLL